MQRALGPNDSSSAANPILDLWVQVPLIVDDGTGAAVSQLAEPVSASWAIFAITSDAQAQSPVQVASGNVDLTTDMVNGQVGHYAATTQVSQWAMPGQGPPPLPFGRYQIVWTYTILVGQGAQGQGNAQWAHDVVKTATRDFDLIQGGAPPALVTGAYATVSDLRDEGLLTTDASDLRLLRNIAMASRFVERSTGRFFEPRLQRQTVDGTGGRAIQTGDPLIALVSLTLGNPVQSTIGLGSLRLFNRHLTERMTNPDDRDDPRIEFVHFKDIFGRQRSASVDSPLFGVPFRDLFFPAGVQNVNVTALFGYTEWDGSSVGDVPYLLRHAVKLIVFREFRQLMDDDRDERKRHRLTAEKVRDQSYQLDKLSEGPYTGDREIDDILLSMRRPMMIGAP